MPEFFEYPEKTGIDGTEMLVILHGGLTKIISAQEFIDASIVTGPAGPTGAPGGGWFARYTFKTTTADADPGLGNLRLNQSTQNTASVIRADLSGSDGTDLSLLLGLLDDSTSTVKGHLRLFKDNDASKFLVFAVTALASPSGYKNISVTPVAYSAASPFAADDLILATFTAAGDIGGTGPPGSTGGPGPTGNTGLQGGALPFNFDTSTGAADPGAGDLRLNNAAPGSATAMYVDDLTSAGVDISAWLAVVCGSTAVPKGFIEIASADKSKSRFYTLSAYAHASSYSTLTVVYIGGAGTFTSAEALYLTIYRNGDMPVRVTQAEYNALSQPEKDSGWWVIIG